jgi:regulator of sirC expression with transglutaminase-like and TPR domain
VSDPRAALEAIGALADAEIEIADAALQLARVDAPEADWEGTRAHLSAIAREAAALAALVDAEDPAAQGAALAALLAGRHSFRGDSETYDDLANANLIRVVERRRGLPVSLGIVWLHAARAAGWEAQGVDFPAHFVIALGAGERQAVLDPFGGGRRLDREALAALLRRIDPQADLPRGPFTPMSTRAVLLRLQNNILIRRLRADDVAGALACAQDMLRIAPAEPELWREAAMLHARLEQVNAALRCFERFAALAPPEAAARARAAMAELRARLN